MKITKYLRVIKFLLSSFASFLIDYILRLLLGMCISGVAANIIARIISATFNFFVNKNVVFENDESTFKAAIKYAMLALLVLTVDTIINEELLIGTLFIPVWIAKPITEVIMFFINYPIQKLFVYKKSKKNV